MTTRPGVALRTRGGERGVRNGFWQGDRGTEGGGNVGIHVKDIIDRFIEAVVASVDVVGLVHQRWWDNLYASRTSGAFLKCSSGSQVHSARE